MEEEFKIIQSVVEESVSKMYVCIQDVRTFLLVLYIYANFHCLMFLCVLEYAAHVFF